MIEHNCTRLTEVISFVEQEQSATRSGWFLDYFFRDRTTEAERLEFRKYTKGASKPLLYSNACLPPNLIDKSEESLTLSDITFPTIKAEGKITGCDVDDRRITPQGDIIPVGIQRFNEAFNWEMKNITDSLRATHIGEAINILRTGGYVLHSSADGNMGTIDFGRADELANIDIVGTNEDWSGICSNPIKSIFDLTRGMRKYKAVSGVIDVVYSEVAWQAMQAYQERDGIKFDERPSETFTAMLNTYDDVEYMGSSNGGKLRHWVSSATYIDHTGTEVAALNDGEILVASKAAFDGQRIFRTITSDNKEKLPTGAQFFVYDDLDKEYNRKCRSFAPWIEEYHVMAPANVNAAVIAKVVPADFEACVACESCEDEPAQGGE